MRVFVSALMGQKGSSSGLTGPTASAKSNEKRPTSLDGLELLGRCWRLANERGAFSPSRWFPLCERTIQLAPAACRARPCFTLAAPRAMSERERKRDPRLLALPRLLLPPGLTVTVYAKVAISVFAAAELRGKRYISVDGVPVDVAFVDTLLTNGEPSHKYICILAVWRMDVEMDLTQYATAPYTRHPVKYGGAVSDAMWDEYGEGCITGIRYGGLMIATASESAVGFSLVNALRAEKTLSSVEWYVKGVDDHPTPKSCAASAGSAELRVFSRVGGTEGGVEERSTVRGCVKWVTGLFDEPTLWQPLGLFLQRYEAVGQCLLTA